MKIRCSFPFTGQPLFYQTVGGAEEGGKVEVGVGIANQNKEEKGPKSIEYIKLAIPTPSSRGGKTGLTFPRFQVFWVAEQLK